MGFVHHDLRLLSPTFSSPLVDVLSELEYLRRLQMSGTTPLPMFLQLKAVFHLLESLASARIEGNHTTLADLIDTRVSAKAGTRAVDALREIENIEAAMFDVEAAVQSNTPISEHLIRNLHARTVENLVREGDPTPGAYRQGSVRIAQAQHVPPEAIQVSSYMQELISFLNRDDPPKYDLMKVALAHHRFAWIHPFRNGNGRVVRLLTYALLIKYGFKVDAVGRLLNPAAVFCNDRERYYSMLALADSGTDTALEAWCEYVLVGVRDELKKAADLANYDYLRSKVLLPALAQARAGLLVSPLEEAMLSVAIEKCTVKASDLVNATPRMTATQRSYQIKKLVERRMLQPIHPGARQYTFGFSNNMLLRCVVRALSAEGFVPPALH